MEGELSLKIKSRGFRPMGGGEIQFKSPFVRFLKGIEYINKGKIKRVRGTCSGTKISP